MNSSSIPRGYRCLNCTIKNHSPLQRTFATSFIRQRYGTVPVFSPTSSPELDTFLTTIRNKIFLPTHLSRSQQDLMYLDKNQRELLNEPVFAYIKGEKFQLEHINRLKDLPSSTDCISKTMKLMTSPRDWDNLPSLLEGLRTAKRKISTETYQKITRIAGKAGRSDIVVECARRVDDTGFILKRPIVLELMFQIQDKARRNGWTGLKSAISLAESVVELLHDERHMGNRHIKGFGDSRVMPETVGVLLQLSAVRAIKIHNSEDRDGKVAQYAHKTLAGPVSTLSWTQDLHSKANEFVTYSAPVLHGLKLAEQVLGATCEGLTERVTKMERAVTAQRDVLLKLDEKSAKTIIRRGISAYNSLLGPDAEDVAATELTVQSADETAETTR